MRLALHDDLLEVVVAARAHQLEFDAVHPDNCTDVQSPAEGAEAASQEKGGNGRAVLKYGGELAETVSAVE